MKIRTLLTLNLRLRIEGMECKSEGVVERGRESESEMCYRLGRSDQARCRFPISTKSRTESPGCARTRFTSQIQPGSLLTRGLSTSSWALAYPIPPPLAPPHWHFPSNAHNPSPTNYSCAFSAHLCQSQCFRSHSSTHHGTNSPPVLLSTSRQFAISKKKNSSMEERL